jgi:4a-hydroxytetrahydrobiopterin dehydratase
MKRRKLDQGEIETALEALPGWTLEHGKLHREMRFDGFVGAFGFMTSMALVSEAMNHHPDWRNVYDRVVVNLSTHDAGGITALDLEWARRASTLVAD